jgi:serine protease AprX
MPTQAQRPRHPVKVVLATEGDYPPREKPSRRWEPFRRVTSSFREQLVGNIREVSAYFAGAFRQWPDVPGIAKVQLRSDAIAKTYRPTEVFGDDTCPIVGASRFGELYVSVTPARLQSLAKRVGSENTRPVKCQLSVLTGIAPFTHRDSFPSDAVPSGEPMRLRLFQHHAFPADARIHAIASELCGKNRVSANDAPYGPSLRILRLDGLNKRGAEALARFPGTQSLSKFPNYKAVRTTSIKLKVLPRDALLAPDANRDYPIVLLIDSGTDPRNQQLQKWVVSRWDAVMLHHPRCPRIPSMENQRREFLEDARQKIKCCLFGGIVFAGIMMWFAWIGGRLIGR